MQHLGFKIFQDGESGCVGNDGALFARIKKKRTSRYYKKKQCYQFDDIYDFTNPHASQMFQKFISARRLIHRQYLAKRETRHSFFFFFSFSFTKAKLLASKLYDQFIAEFTVLNQFNNR